MPYAVRALNIRLHMRTFACFPGGVIFRSLRVLRVWSCSWGTFCHRDDTSDGQPQPVFDKDFDNVHVSTRRCQDPGCLCTGTRYLGRVLTTHTHTHTHLERLCIYAVYLPGDRVEILSELRSPRKALIYQRRDINFVPTGTKNPEPAYSGLGLGH